MTAVTAVLVVGDDEDEVISFLDATAAANGDHLDAVCR